MTADRPEAEKKAQALLKQALSHHNAKQYNEAAGFYELILKRYPDTEAAQYAQKNLENLVNKVQQLEPIQHDQTYIQRIENSVAPESIAKPAVTPPIIKPPQLDSPSPATRSKPAIKPTRKWPRIADDPYLLAGLFFLTAIVSYFIGREHVKYEIRQTFTGAADGFHKDMAEVMTPLKKPGQDPMSAPAEPKVKQDVNKPKVLKFPIVLNEKELKKSGYVDYIAFTINIENTLDRPIKAFEGRILFKDVLGKLVLGATMSYRDGMAAKSRANWSGTISYNQFMSDHNEFINLEKSQLVPELVIEKVAYEDGAIEEFPKP